jgi:hypothetical protein
MSVLRMEQLVERVPGWLSSVTCCLSGMPATTLDRGCRSRDLLPRRHFVNGISLADRAGNLVAGLYARKVGFAFVLPSVYRR